MDNTRISSLQEAKANFEEIKKFAKQSAQKEFENEINEKVDKILKESLTIEIDDDGNVTVDNDEGVIDLAQNPETEIGEKVSDITDEEDNEPIEIEEMITLEQGQDEITPQVGVEPAVEPAVAPEMPAAEEMPIAPEEGMPAEEVESVEQIAQNLADEIIKLVQTSTEQDATGAPEVTIDDEAAVEEMPIEPEVPMAPPVQEDNEIFEISLEEIEGAQEEMFEINLGEESKEEYFEVDPNNEEEISAMLSAVGDISKEGGNWKDEMNSDLDSNMEAKLAAAGDISREEDIWKDDLSQVNIPNLEESEELEEVKMMGVSNTVQKSAGTSVGPEKSVEYRNRQTSSMPVNENKAQHESKVDELSKENKRLNESVKEMNDVITNYQESFKGLRKQFDEMQTFNAKLAYANKIFASGGLSTVEKTRIAEQFDKTNSVDQAKTLYDSILKENKISVNTNNVQKIKSPVTNAAKPQKNDAKPQPLYESKEMKRMKVMAGIDKPEEI